MRLSLRKPAQHLFRTEGRTYAGAAAFALFQEAARKLVSRTSEDETEEFQRRIITAFVQELRAEPEWHPETDAGGALRLTDAEDGGSSRTLLVVKRAYGAEMMTPLKPNVKALHTLILSCFEHYDTYGNLPECLVVTDGFSWFWFDASDIRTYFIDHPKLRYIFQLKKQGKTETVIYAGLARTIREIQADIPVTYLNLRELVSQPEQQSTEWINAFLLFSNLSASYNAADETDPELMERLAPIREEMPDAFPVWFCRLLFLRALECKIAAIGGQVPIAIGEVLSNDDVAAILNVWKNTHPALLSVETTEWPAPPDTVPPDEAAAQPASPVVRLAHMLADCEIITAGPPVVIPEGRFVCTAAGVDALFAWLTGETAAPMNVVREITRNAVQEAVQGQLSALSGLGDTSFEQLTDKLASVPVDEALAIFRSVAICDVYAGSGRILQLALQELVQLQHRSGLLTDGQGQSMHHYTLAVVNGQVQLATLDGEPVYYRITGPVSRNTEPQRIRKALFDAKKALLTSVLFGVVPDKYQRMIALTRLSLELLTDLYAVADKKKGTAWPVFPGLTWQLQSGNGLLYQLNIQLPLLYGEEELTDRLSRLKQQVQNYYDRETAASGRQIDQQLGVFRQHLQAQTVLADRPLVDRLTRLQAVYTQRYAGNLLFPEQLTPSQQADQEKLRLDITRLTQRLEQRRPDDQDGFEWRIRWPTRFNESGGFTGFNAIISQPPATPPAIPESWLNAFKTQYKAVYAAQEPAFVYYLWLSGQLLAEEQAAWLIVPSGWEKKSGTKKLQTWLAGQTVWYPETTEETVTVIRIQKQVAVPTREA
nr:hypothetical protein [uncultured Arsenicibacter sp.]